MKEETPQIAEPRVPIAQLASPSKPLASFSTLPTEVKLIIFRLALSSHPPRWLTIYRADGPAGTQFSHHLPTTPLTQACFLSRTVALTHGLFITQVGEGSLRGRGGVYFRAAEDVVHLRGSILDGISLDAGVCGLAGLERARRLVISPDSRVFDAMLRHNPCGGAVMDLFLRIWRYFPALEELYVVPPGTPIRPAAHGGGPNLETVRRAKIKPASVPPPVEGILDRVVLGSPTKMEQFWEKVKAQQPERVRSRIKTDVKVGVLVRGRNGEWMIREE